MSAARDEIWCDSGGVGPTGSWHVSRERVGNDPRGARPRCAAAVRAPPQTCIDSTHFPCWGAQDVLLAEERLNAAMRFDIEDADAEHDNHSQSDYSDRSMSGEAARVDSLDEPLSKN